MDEALREQFFHVVLRFRKTGIPIPSQCTIQMSELTVMQRITQECIQAEQCKCVSDIQDQLPISKPAVSQILNSLEKKGFIVRQIDKGDRRKISVRATPEGVEALEQSLEDHNKVLKEVLTRFGEENLFALITELNRLTDVYEQVKIDWIEKDSGD